MPDSTTINLKSPTIVELTLTGKCNHRCSHCFNPWRSDEEMQAFRKTLTKREIDIIAEELSINEVFHIVLSGGEPLTEFKTTLYALDAFTNKGFSVALNSNLSLLNLQKINELNKYDVDFLLTSLPSSNKKTTNGILQVKAFDRIIEGIRLCVENKLPVGINSVINKTNIDEVYETARFLSGIGVKYFFASVAIPPNYDPYNKQYFLTDKDIVKLGKTLLSIESDFGLEVSTVTPLPLCVLKDAHEFRSITQKACTGGITHCTISNNGDIVACSHESEPYGNVFKDGLKSAWERMEVWRNGSNLNNDCRHCDFLAICGGECRILSESYPNRPFSKQVLESERLRIDTDVKLPTGIFKFNEESRFRSESFGGTVCLNGTKNIFLNQEGVSLYHLLQDLNSFTLDQLEEYVEVDQELITAIGNFISNEIILIN